MSAPLQHEPGRATPVAFAGVKQFRPAYRRVVASVTVLLVALAGYATGSSRQSAHSSVEIPKFVAVDRAFGENADDETLRSCMTRTAKELLAGDAGAVTDIDYDRILEFVNDPSQRDVQWDTGVLARGTVPYQIFEQCRKALPGPMLAIGDLDGDQLPEVAFHAKGVLKLWWNKGLGKFQLEEIGYVPVFGIVLVTFADVDGDTRPDIVTIDPVTRKIATLYNNGNRKFFEAAVQGPEAFDYVGGDANWTITNTDLDKNGLVDLVIANRSAGVQITEAEKKGATIKPLRIFYNTGQRNAPWQERTLRALPVLDELTESTSRASYSTTTGSQISGAYQATVADFNNDTWPDIYVASDFLTPRLFFGQPGGRKFTDVTIKSKVTEGLQNTMSSSPIDYDNDGWLDIIATDVDLRLGECFGLRACGGFGGHRLLRNNRDGTFTDVAVEIGINDAGWGFAFTLNDLNNDGYGDFLVATGDLPRGRTEPHWLTTFQKPYLLVRGEDGWVDGSLNLLRELRSPSANSILASADFDGDLRPDVVFYGLENRAPYLLLNRSDGNVASVLVKGKGRGGSPTGGEGALVKVRQKNRPDQTYHLYDNMSNFMAQTTSTPFTVGLGSNDEAEITVTFPSGVVVTRTVKASKSYVISE